MFQQTWQKNYTRAWSRQHTTLLNLQMTTVLRRNENKLTCSLTATFATQGLNLKTDCREYPEICVPSCRILCSSNGVVPLATYPLFRLVSVQAHHAFLTTDDRDEGAIPCSVTLQGGCLSVALFPNR